MEQQTKRRAPKAHHAENDVIAALDRGLTHAQIAAETDISQRTVRRTIEHGLIRREAVNEASSEIE
jgi:DNA-binding NarL/FixJ family response regulator